MKRDEIPELDPEVCAMTLSHTTQELGPGLAVVVWRFGEAKLKLG